MAEAETGAGTKYPHRMPSILRVGPVDALDITAPVGGREKYAELCTTKAESDGDKCDQGEGKDHLEFKDEAKELTNDVGCH